MRRKLPCCGYKPNTQEEIKMGSNHVLPKKGDATICYNCGSWHIYKDDNYNTRPFTAEDLLGFDDDELHIMRRATKAIKRRGRMR